MIEISNLTFKNYKNINRNNINNNNYNNNINNNKNSNNNINNSYNYNNHRNFSKLKIVRITFFTQWILIIIHLFKISLLIILIVPFY